MVPPSVVMLTHGFSGGLRYGSVLKKAETKTKKQMNEVRKNYIYLVVVT